MATIKDVARRAGVSVASVSRHINQNGYVGNETGQKIEAAIQELNYVPNEVARSLFQKKSKIIGVLLPDIVNPYFPLLAKGIEETLMKNGYMMLLANTLDSEEQLKQYSTTFIQNNVNGIITALPLALPAGISVVGIDRAYEGSFNKILADDYLGGKLAGEEIVKTEFKKILIITGKLSLGSARKRLEGLSEVLDSHAAQYEVYEAASYSVHELDKISDTFFECYSSFDTVIASNDYLALKIMQKAQQRGFKIPKDLQIMGYDGIPFSGMMYPKLTTIKQPVYEIGREAAELVVQMVQGKTPVQQEKMLPVSLEKGESLRKRFTSVV